MKKTVRNLFRNDYSFSVIARLLSFAINLLYSVMYSRYLQPELRGRASVILNYASLIMLVLCLGINQGYPYFRKQDKENAYRNYINVVSAFFLLYAAAAAVLICFFRAWNDPAVTVILIPLMFAVKELNYAVMVENPGRRNRAAILLSVMDVVLILFFVLFVKAGLTACFIFIVLKEALYFVVAVYQLKVGLLTIRPSFREAGKYVKYGFFPMLTVILMEINYKADVLMLDAFRIPKAQIGIYTLAVSMAEKIWLIPDALKDILVGRLAKGRDEREVQKVSRISFAVVIALSAVFAAVGSPILNRLYGEDYNGTYEAMLILLTGIIGMIFYKTVYSYNVTQGRRVINLVLLGIASLTNVIANAFLIPAYGINGAAAASSVSYLVCGILFLIYFCRTTNTKVSGMLLMKKEDLSGTGLFPRRKET